MFKTFFTRVIPPLLVIGLGVAVLVALVKSKPEAAKKDVVDRGTLVEVIRASKSSHTVKVEAKGTVVPARQVVLSPEVGGRVVWLAPEVTPGGRVKKGQTLVRIDASEYRLAVEQQFAAFDRAKTELEIERGRKKIAEREWELFGPKGPSATPTPSSVATADGGTAAPATTEPAEVLALREPQMRTAKTAVKSAESGLSRAKLNVSRTVVKAPFNALIRDRNLEVGQLVGPTMALATLIGTDAYWVQVSVPVDRLSWIDIPGIRGASAGSLAKVTQEIGDEVIERQGRVVRLLGDVDPAGRMARILVEITNPLDVAADSAGSAGLPLLIGSYVHIEVEGGKVVDVVTIPRVALREGNKVFVNVGNTLEIREVTVVWRGRHDVYVSAGLEAGDAVITSPVAAPVAGAKLRVAGSEAAAADSAPSKAEAAAVVKGESEVGKP